MTGTGPTAAATPSGGLTFVPSSGGVISLNYYDGRFLRADDLNLERRSQREYSELSNRAQGAGPVWGFDLSGLGTAELRLSAGLALSPRGQVLSMTDNAGGRVADLLSAAPSPGETPSAGTGFAPCAAPTATTGGSGGTAVTGTALYLVCLSAASLPQGISEVFGRLCEGCVTPTDSPYLVDGVTLQLRPLTLNLQPWSAPGLTRPDLHLRSQVASAFFAAEQEAAGPAMSAALLASAVWGAGAASLAGDDAVAVGVLGWDGAAIVLLDQWTARREIIQTPPAIYWAGSLEQRPLPVFLGQVLQFQSQLATAPAAPGGSVQQLVDRGFVELPAAGYLPVPGGGVDLRTALSAQFGPGVELRLCAVRQDQIPREFERGQHRDRISLLRGLRDAAAREQVDILVPDGLLAAAPSALEFAVDVVVGEGSASVLEGSAQAPRGTARGRGAARWQPGPGIGLQIAAAIAMPQWGDTFGRFLRGRQEGVGGFDAFVAGTRTSPAVKVPDVQQLKDLAVRIAAATAGAQFSRAASVPVAVGDLRVLSAAASLTVDADPLSLPEGGSTRFHLEASGYQPSGRSSTSVLLQVSGTLVRVTGTVAGAITVAATGVYGINETAAGGATGSGGTFENRSLVLTPTAVNGTTVTITDPASGLTAQLNWTGHPIQAELKVTARARDAAAEPTPIAALTAGENPSVLRTGNAYHDSAAAALAMLAAAHPDDPQFAERAYQELFPSGDVGIATVQARRDWVLFRRRERKDCEGAPVTPNPSDTVTVQVLHVADAAEVEKAVDAVLSGSRGWPDGWTATEVVFDGGTTTLLTPQAGWRQRYAAAGGAEAVALAGYAPAAGSLGALVGVGRLKALLAALAPEVTLDPGAPTVPVNPPGALLPATGTDGSAFLVTHPQAPPRVPALAVRALWTEGNRATITRLQQPDATLATDVAPFEALGEGGTSTLDIDRIVAELTTLERDLTAQNVEIETLLWTFDPLDATVADAMASLAGTVESQVGAMPSTTVRSGQRSTVAFGRTDNDLVAQLFLLVTLKPQGN